MDEHDQRVVKNAERLELGVQRTHGVVDPRGADALGHRAWRGGGTRQNVRSGGHSGARSNAQLARRCIENRKSVQRFFDVGGVRDGWVKVQKEWLGGIVRLLNKVEPLGCHPLHVVRETQRARTFFIGAAIVHVSNVKSIGKVKASVFGQLDVGRVDGRSWQPIFGRLACLNGDMPLPDSPSCVTQSFECRGKIGGFLEIELGIGNGDGCQSVGGGA